jgi:hypothetical protein
MLVSMFIVHREQRSVLVSGIGNSGKSVCTATDASRRFHSDPDRVWTCSGASVEAINAVHPRGTRTLCVLFRSFIAQFHLTPHVSQHENKGRPPDDPSLSVSIRLRVHPLLYPSSSQLYHQYALTRWYLHSKFHLGFHLKCTELTHG